MKLSKLLIPTLLTVVGTLLVREAQAIPYHGTTQVNLQLMFCNPWDDTAKGVNPFEAKNRCFQPHVLKKAKVYIRELQNHTLVATAKSDTHGKIQVALRQGIYDFYVDSTTKACVAGKQLHGPINGCRVYGLASLDGVVHSEKSSGPGRTFGISGRERHAVIRFYERSPV